VVELMTKEELIVFFFRIKEIIYSNIILEDQEYISTFLIHKFCLDEFMTQVFELVMIIRKA